MWFKLKGKFREGFDFEKQNPEYIQYLENVG